MLSKFVGRFKAAAGSASYNAFNYYFIKEGLKEKTI